MLRSRRLRLSSTLDLLRAYGWYEWLCHSNFSFLIGASHPHEYIDRAVGLGYQGLAMTDFDGVYGLARTHLHLAQRRKHERQAGGVKNGPFQDFKLIHGMELHLAQDHRLPLLYQDTIVVIARTRTAYSRLCTLATDAHRESKNDAWVPLQTLLEHSVDDLIAIQPMRGLIRRGYVGGREERELERRSAILADHFQGRFYFALSRHFNPSEDAWIQPTIALARRLGRKCLLSQDAFFHDPSQKDLSDLLHAIRNNRCLPEAAEHFFVNAERSLPSLANLAQRFGELPIYESALQASRELADSCMFDLSELRYQYPKEMIPDGMTAQAFLEQLTWEAAHQRYGKPLPSRMTQTLSHELALIEQLQFADYFLTVWDIVRWARSRGILCQGRGSAANSAVCFVLGVTAVDPALFDLLFERFVSVERGDPPDIDIDFEHERREEVIQYIYERYGRAQAAMVANVITFRSKGALRAVGKALGISDRVLENVSQTLDGRYFRHRDPDAALAEVRQDYTDDDTEIETPDALLGNWTAAESQIDDASKSAKISIRATAHPGFSAQATSNILAEENSLWTIWSTMAQRLKGFPRHLGIHSGGFMIADQPLDTLVAQEPATMEGRSVIQWSKEDIEGLGFFKIDILALGMLTAIRKCCDSIQRYYGVHLELSTIPQEDAATYAMIQRADTVGTFQIESRAQMSMLPRLKPRTFYDLVVEVAIIRPGPIQGGMIHPYLRRREGLEPVSFPDERLRPILARTLGVPIFQEQVMRIAMEVGGFSAGEANELRKHMGAFQMKGNINPWLQRLADGMRKNGISEEFAQSILAQMRGFAEYGFPESHSVSFALIAYASAYLKCHYPAAFFMALLNSQPMGFYQPHVLLETARRAGVSILPVCVQHSSWDSELENTAPAGKPAVYGLRMGLSFVGGLRRDAAVRVEQARHAAGGAFADLRDFLQRSNLFRPDITALAAARAFACFGLERKAAIWLAEAAPFCPFIEDVEDTIAWPTETRMQSAEQDFMALGTTLGPHPTKIIREEHWCYTVAVRRLLAAKDLKQARSGQIVEVFGLILVRQSPGSANGMVFVTMEDDSGFINLVFTPSIYEKCYRLVERQAFLCVRGKLQRQGDTHSVLVQLIYEPHIKRAEVIPLQNRERRESETSESLAWVESDTAGLKQFANMSKHKLFR